MIQIIDNAYKMQLFAHRWRYLLAQARPSPKTRRAAPPLVLCEQSVRDIRSSRFSARKSSVLPTHVVSPGGGDNAQGRQTQRVQCTAQIVVSHVLPIRTFSRGVYVTIHNIGILHDVACNAGGERALRISDRQDGGVPGAVVVERCIELRQRV